MEFSGQQSAFRRRHDRILRRHRNDRVGKNTLFSYIELLATIAVAFLILGQSLSPLQALGVLIVVGALVMAEMVSLRDTEPAHTET